MANPSANLGELTGGAKTTGSSNTFFSGGTMSLIGTGLEVGTKYFAYQAAKYETKRQNAVAQTKYWREWANQEASNWRDYEVQLNNYYNNKTWAETRRQFESLKQELQAGYKGEVALSAMKNFERQMADIEGRFYEEEAKEIIELENVRRDIHAKGVKKIAGGQVGNSVQAIQSAKDQQWLTNLSNRQITREFRLADKQKAIAAADVARQNTVNQVKYYTPTPVQDPVKPLTPLPVEGVEPTAAMAPASSLTIGLDLVSTAFDAYMNYKDYQPSDEDMTQNEKVS